MHTFWITSLMIDVQMNEDIFIAHEDGTTNVGKISLEQCKFDTINNRLLIAFTGDCHVTAGRVFVYLNIEPLKDDLGYYMVYKRPDVNGEYALNTTNGLKFIKLW